MGLTRETRLLDIACGPGILAIGFARFVGSATAIDREPEMLRAARAAAADAGVAITFMQTAIEDLQGGERFDFVTIGRAQHWLPRDKTLGVLERVVAPGGRIAICGSRARGAPVNSWAAKFKEVRNAWASDPDESRYKIDMDAWFAGTRFRRVDDIAVKYRQFVTIPELIGRALSLSITSPAVIGERRPQFEAELRTALEPFAQKGTIEEEVVAKATIFG